MKLSIKGFFSKFDQIRRKLEIWSHLLKKSLIDNFIFCAVYILSVQQRKQFLYRSVSKYKQDYDFISAIHTNGNLDIVPKTL